ncbi:MAG: transcription antitermination factor NusB [Chitinophagaceae bacterium]
MISRRNIRVTVMQLIYALETADKINDTTEAIKILQIRLKKSEELFVYLLYFITEVARYAEINACLRASRHLTTSEDRNVNTKIAGNALLWEILENDSYKKAVASVKPQLYANIDLIKRIYNKLEEADLYKKYIAQAGRDKKTEKEILQFIFTDLMLPDENFIANIEELFSNWDDDAEMINQLILNYLQKPSAYNLQNIAGDEKIKFAKDLLITTIEKKEQLTEFIKPKLKNWDAERIAMLDMILMRMGVCEFLFFETIPPKVTINEYIDIAKDYSTQQSGQFVNGILDNIHKDFLEQKKIHKIDFRQKA